MFECTTNFTLLGSTTLRKVDHKNLESFEKRLRKRGGGGREMTWSDRVKNEV
jgi:hypothetical protein